MTVLRNIGRWNINHPDDPDLRDLIDVSWDQEQVSEVADYLENGMTLAALISNPQNRHCRLCEFSYKDDLLLTDGVYVWPQLLCHYVSAHKVRLPQVIIDDMMSRWDALEQSQQDVSWWRRLAAIRKTTSAER